MIFLVIDVALDVAQVFWHFVLLCYLGSINPSGWIASPMIAFVFLGGLGLGLISGGGGAVGLSLVFVLGSLILGLPVGIFIISFC